ncbi:hypothetical protein QFC19_008340 [Naganishia cerealis]|uniref:Uncharacterized protein n=1 Tax=Naganishia cerealis TaxID=610337 RepID=A0ACC2V3T0_9TREE|nr:hypothetical protein QFC19_008340 [Naganishia cerealis]
MPPLPPPLPPTPPVTLPSSHPATAPATESLLAKSQKFIEEHKLLVLGAAVVAVSGAGYYLYSSHPSTRKPPRVARADKDGESDDDDEQDVTAAGAPVGSVKSEKKKKKKAKSKKKSAAAAAASSLDKLATAEDSPLLQERDAEEVKRILEKKRAKEQEAGVSTQGQELKPENLADKEASAPAAAAADSTTAEAVPAYLEGVPRTKQEIAKLSSHERKTLATTLKTRGNKLYGGKKYLEAIACYTKALEVADREEAVFYSNRAACYQNMSPPNYEQVIKDCDAALQLDSGYVKALNRRATAYEALGRDEEALRDFTATTIMEKFQNDAASSSVERVLKKISTKKAEEMLSTREPRLPSKTFVSAYLGAFRPRPKPEFPELPANSTNTGNNTFSLALDAQTAGDYTRAFMLVNEALEQGISPDWKQGQAEALNMRGTYKFLLGDSAGAKEDLEKSLDLVPDYVQSLVKVASVHMEMGDAAGAFGDFEAAIRHNPNDPDIYYHRGQLYFVTNAFDKAIEDYERSTYLDEDFIFSHVQHAVAQYKMGQTRESMAAFRDILRKFRGKSEPLNYYGELLLDQQRFEDAIRNFDEAIEIERKKTPTNVLPLVNKALAVFQWKQDMATAEALCKEALEIDEECDVAVATAAQLSLQQGKIPEAIKWFEQSAKLARTEAELTAAITYEHASKAQMAFLQNYPQMAERLGQLASQM